jgi:GNAT superfamily N-acetyltransferase
VRVATPEKLSDKVRKEILRLELLTFGSRTLSDQEIGEANWWFVYHKGIAVGFTGLLYYPYLKQPAAFLYRSGVLKDYRGYGLQKRFIRVRERQSLKDGYNRIITYTSYDNYPSANSLISCGYKLYRPPTDWGVKNAYYFEKKL